MPETRSTRGGLRWQQLTGSIGAKLIGLLLAVMLVIFALLAYLNIRLHRRDLEVARLASAESISDVIRRSTTYYMLRNDRQGFYHTIQTIADQPGMVRIRILDQDGRICCSSDPAEDHVVNEAAGPDYSRHNQSQPLMWLNPNDRFRIYRSSDGQRVLEIITPIENQPSCSNAACHAHPASQKVLGLLDTNLSLAQADAQLAASSTRIFAYTAAAVLIVAVLSWIFVWRVVDRPIKTLKQGTEHLSRGDLGYQIQVDSQDEIGDLAASFNGMSTQLRAANEQIVDWAKTLENRVEEKTRQLKSAHQHILNVEKMASLGKMAAVVAHEVNNPLSGILTYAKLLRKWVATGQAEHEKQSEAMECLDLIATESRRCGDLIHNLLTFSRGAPMNVQAADLRQVIDRTLLLVRHPLELAGIELQMQLRDEMPTVRCDPAQIEQVLLALIMNAIDAMPRGGNLWISTRLTRDESEVQIEVRDDGVGISPDILPHIFEPFVTTKESGHGVGLGLAISRGIVERHGGGIEVESHIGLGTTFTVTLPIEPRLAELAGASSDAAMKVR
jgi:two-component system, NtrC family, sensor kinase